MVTYDLYDVEGSDGDEKLAIVNAPKGAVKGTNWKVTQYEPIYDDIRFDFAWAIDISEESFEAMEKALDFVIPAERKPWVDPSDTDKGTVRLVRDPVHAEVRVELGDDPEGSRAAISFLRKKFSYTDPDTKYGPGPTRTISVWSNPPAGAEQGISAPLGVLDTSVEALEANGFTVDLRGPDGGVMGDEISLSWESPHSPRDYQREAVAKLTGTDNPDADAKRAGVISLPTGTGKTFTALKAVQEIDRRAIIFVHTKELLYQWADEIRDVLGVEPGLIGDGQWSEGPVTVAIMQSLVSAHKQGQMDIEGGERELDPSRYGVSVYDECHKTSAAETFHTVGQIFPSHWRIGLSATPWRKVSGQELWIEGATGAELYGARGNDMINAGYLACPVYETLEHDGPTADSVGLTHHTQYQKAYSEVIAESPERNKAIGKRAAELAREGRTVIVNTRWINPAKAIASAAREELTGDDIEARAIWSDTDNREELLDRFADDSDPLRVVPSTLLKEGVDIPSVDAVIMAHAGKSKVETVQVMGRALRPDTDTAMIVDVKDTGTFFGDAYEERQAAMNDYYEEYGPDGDAGPQDAGQSVNVDYDGDDRDRDGDGGGDGGSEESTERVSDIDVPEGMPKGAGAYVKTNENVTPAGLLGKYTMEPNEKNYKNAEALIERVQPVTDGGHTTMSKSAPLLDEAAERLDGLAEALEQEAGVADAEHEEQIVGAKALAKKLRRET